ncbi:MAG TPA: oligosaccharide flippase family protein [Chitinophagaceae bacterium]|nr:oligosaccharide flippase family protein [Chitinophagaceae bacterium]
MITVIFSRKLNYNDYGTFQSVWMYANIVNVIVSFGFSSVLLSANLPFFFRFVKENKKTIISFYTILSIICFSAFFLLAKNFDSTLKLLLIGFMIVQNIITVAETLLLKRHGEIASFIINVFYSLLFFGCHIAVLLVHYSLSVLMISLVILSALKLAAIYSIPARSEDFAPAPEENNFMHHWIFLGLTEILGVISRWIDKVFLLYLLTASDFAVFFNGSFEIPFFGLLISVAGSLMMIEFSGSLYQKDKIISVFKETADMLSSIVFPLFFFLFFFRYDLFSFIFKDKYNDSVPIFAISIFILPLRINNYSVMLQCFSLGKKVLTGAIIDIIIALALMIILYPAMGSRGIVLSIVISTYIQTLYFLWESAKLVHTTIFNILPLRKLLTKFLLLLVIYFCCSSLVSSLSVILKIAVATIVTLITIAAGTWSYLKALLTKR